MSKLSKKSPIRKRQGHIVSLHRSCLFAILLLTIVTSIAYYNSFQGSWHFDDELAITQNHVIKKIENIPYILRNYLSRGVLQTTFALNYYLGGLDIFGYHLVNLVFHILVVILIYLIVHNLISVSNLSSSSSHLKYLPLFSALLFATHPVNTESVTYIISRSSVLATLFYLLGFFFFIKTVRIGKQQTSGLVVKQTLLFVGCAAAFILGIGTKEIIITLPAMLLIYLYYFVSEDHNPLSFIKSYKWPLCGLLFAIAGYFSYRHFHGGIIASIPDIRVRSFYVNFLTEMNVVVRYYLRRLFFPVGLNIDPDFPLAKSFLQPATIFSALVIAGAIFLVIRSLKTHRIFSFFVLWFFVTLTPTSSFIPLLDVAAEHRVYLPGVGFSVVLVYIIIKFMKHWITNKVVFQKTAVGSLSVIILLFSIGTIRRNTVYRNPHTLWKDTVSKSPQKARPHDNLGNSYERIGKLDEAREEYKLIIEKINPDYMRAYYGLGNVHRKMGRSQEAIEEYQRALSYEKTLKANPSLAADFALVHNNLAMVYHRSNMYEKAKEEYQKALKLDPNFIKAYNNLAILYAQKKMYDKAISTINKALTKDPGYSVGYANLGNMYLETEDYEKARQALQIAVKIDPEFAEAYRLLGDSYLNLKDWERALYCFRRTLNIDPAIPQARSVKAIIERLEKGQLDDLSGTK